MNFQETGDTAIGIHWYKESDNLSQVLSEVHRYLMARLCNLPLSLVKCEALTTPSLLCSVSTPFLTLLLVRKVVLIIMLEHAFVFQQHFHSNSDLIEEP